MTRYQAVRGTFDVLPDRMWEWYLLEKTARTLAIRFGFREIRTPLFERAELYTKGMGVMAGLIEKELWTFQDKFGQKLALRADMTAGIVRAYQQHRLSEKPAPQKLFYIAPVFLLGKEGEESSRQSHQFGFEALGSDSPALDAEVIALASSFCDEFGLKGHTIRLNSVGCDESRPLYQQKLKDYFGAHSDQLCGTCKRKYKAHPEWVLSCSEEGCTSLSQVAPTIYGLLTNGAKEHFNRLKEYLQAMDLSFELEPRLVRDTEYYKRTVFDICYEGKSLGFGGRYDNLAERLGGKATPGVGFALSIEAVLDVLAEQEDREQEQPAPSLSFFFQAEGPESAKLLVPLLHHLRTEGITAEFDYQAEYARPQKPPSGCRYLLYLDESNAFRGHAILTYLDSGKDEKVSISRLAQKVRQLAGVSSPSSSDERPSQGSRKKLRRGRKRSEEDKTVRSEAETKSASDQSDSRNSGETESSSGEETRSRSRSKDSRRDARKSNEEGSRTPKDRESQEPRKRQAAEKERRPADRDTSPKRGRSKPAREASSDDGKAVVPALVLGGSAPASSAPATPSTPTKKKPEKKAKPIDSAPVPELNWSILPGQDSKSNSEGNGSSKSSKKKESRS